LTRCDEANGEEGGRQTRFVYAPELGIDEHAEGWHESGTWLSTKQGTAEIGGRAVGKWGFGTFPVLNV
jgi:hypothetical protein